MLTELICVMIVAVPLVLGCMSYSKNIDEKVRSLFFLHRTIHSTFFKGKCLNGAECSNTSIKVRYIDEIKVRLPSRPFNKDVEVRKDEALNGLYEQIKEEIKRSSEQ